MTAARRFSHAAAWMFVGNWVEQFLNFAVFVILARLLGVETFGLAAMAAATVLLAEFLVRETLTEALISRETITPGHTDAAFWSLLALSAVLVVLICLAAWPLALLNGQPALTDLIRAFSPSVLIIGASAVPTALLRREMRFRAIALRAMAGVALGGVVGLWMAMNGYGVWALVGQRLTLVAVNAAMAWIACGWRPGLRATGQDAREILGFGGRVLTLRAAELVSVQTPALAAGPILGPLALGYFAVAWRLTEIASALLNRPIQMVAQPAFAALRREGGNAARMLDELVQISGVLALAAFLGMAVLAGPLVTVLLGAKWAPAVPILQVLSFVGFYLCVARTQNVFCLAAGEAGGIARLAIGEAALGVVLILAAAPFGPVWVAVAFVVRFWLLWPLRFGLLERIGGMGLRAVARGMLPGLGGVAVMGFVVVAWRALTADALSPELSLVGGAVIGLAVFALYLALVMPDRVRGVIRRLRARG